jgi:hypothetical protein
MLGISECFNFMIEVSEQGPRLMSEADEYWDFFEEGGRGGLRVVIYHTSLLI